MANGSSSGGTDKKVTFKLALDSSSFTNSFNTITSNLKSQANKAGKSVSNSAKKNGNKVKTNATSVASTVAKKVKTACKTIINKVASACNTINAKTKTLRTKIISSITSTMSSITSKIRTSLLVIAALITTQLYKAIEEASNLTEVQNVVDTAFKDMSDQVETFAKNATESFGLSELSAKKYAGQLKSISNAMGIANEEGTEMSLTLTGLSGDLASFYNTSSDEAFTALKGVYTGETEALKKYGIAMTTANLETYALSQGITKSYNAMSQAEKITLRYNYILSVTTDQQGDFAKTADSYSNQLRILKQNWTQLLSVLGDGLVQILTPLLQRLNSIVTSLTSMAQAISDVLVEVFGFEKQSTSSGGSTLSDTYEDIANSADDATESIESATEAAEEGLASFDKINTIGSDSSSSASSSSSSSGSSGLTLSDSPYNLSDSSSKTVSITANINYDKIKAFFEWWKERIENAKKAFKNAFSNVDWEPLSTAWSKFKDVAGDTIDWLVEKAATLAAWFSSEILPILLEIASEALPLITDIIDAIDWEWIGDIIKGILTWILEKLKAIREWAEENPEKFQKIVDIASKILIVLLVIVPIISKIITFVSTIVTVVSTIWEWGSLIASVISGPVLAAILLVIAAIAIWIINWDSIKELAGMLWEEICWFCEDLADKIKTFFTNVKNWFTNLIEGIKTIFTNLKNLIKAGIDTVKEWFSQRIQNITDLVSGFKDKVVGFFQNIADKAKSIFEGVKNTIKGVCNIGIRAINALINGLNKFSIDVPDWVPGIGGKTFGFNIPTIPELANGGVINQPTVAMMGEYAGARHDPEIASKESELKSIFSDTLDEFTNRIVAALQGSNNQPQEINLQIHGKNLMSWIRDENQRESYRRGTPQLS